MKKERSSRDLEDELSEAISDLISNEYEIVLAAARDSKEVGDIAQRVRTDSQLTHKDRVRLSAEIGLLHGDW